MTRKEAHSKINTIINYVNENDVKMNFDGVERFCYKQKSLPNKLSKLNEERMREIYNDFLK